MPLYLDPDALHTFRDLNQGPGAMLDLIGAMAFRAAGTAQRLGLFEVVAAGPMSAAALAGKLGVPEQPLTVLLDALTGFGYLERTGEQYAAGPAASPWLDRNAGGGFAPALAVWHDLIGELWTGLEHAVRTGRPREPYYPWLERRPGTLRDFQTMLAGLAWMLAPAVVKAAPPVRGSLLDIGGGHAIYSLAFCRAAADLTATVVDLPGALEQGRAHVADAGLADRVRLVPGDLADPIEGRHDAVLLFNVVHGLDPSANADLFERVFAALRPGGVVLVLEPFADPPAGTGGHDAAFLGGFSLNLAATQGGRLYAFDEVAGWASAAGLTGLERLALDAPSTDELLVARREAQ
ncbi:methyltransferase domain-containing protein [Nonomuraea sp. NN258]|uniref:class I SAM-dependent methyltransferase n=1 Tax=Nonomuraea antri TaxID=2730852 RepID=UPI00156A12B1|nr:class I SAM-dependent methyltransferase [Nonomuraea antri]NRQ30982.1 methyltransferase domain-containing protein [Nonomuraea antri]